MTLTRNEKRAILEGRLKAIIRTERPDLSDGDELTVAMSRPRPYTDPETKHVFRPPPERAAWITVTNIVRRAKGGWAIHFRLTDNRQTAWLLAKGGGYTTIHAYAMDHLEVPVDEATQRRLTAQARQVTAERRAAEKDKAREDQRRQERAFRDRLRETLTNLDPAGRVVLLAALERQLEAAGAEGDQKAA